MLYTTLSTITIRIMTGKEEKAEFTRRSQRGEVPRERTLPRREIRWERPTGKAFG